MAAINLKNSIRSLITVGFCLILFSCHRSETDQVKLTEHDMTRATIDVELPTALWDKIDSIYSSGVKKEGGEKKVEGAEESDPLLDEVSKEYVPLTVELIEKSDNKGILQSHNHRLYFGDGGGVIDLADFVEDRRGTYYLKVIFGEGKPEPSKEESGKESAKESAKKDFGKEKIRVFYLGNARKRRWNGKIIGSGCSKYFDVTSFFAKSMKGQGFVLNTTDHLDVTSMSGSFFFAAQIDKTLYISQLSIKDSRFNSLQCRPMMNKVESL